MNVDVKLFEAMLEDIDGAVIDDNIFMDKEHGRECIMLLEEHASAWLKRADEVFTERNW